MLVRSKVHTPRTYTHDLPFSHSSSSSSSSLIQCSFALFLFFWNKWVHLSFKIFPHPMNFTTLMVVLPSPLPLTPTSHNKRSILVCLAFVPFNSFYISLLRSSAKNFEEELFLAAFFRIRWILLCWEYYTVYICVWTGWE